MRLRRSRSRFPGRSALAALILLPALLAAGCGQADPTTPEACTNDPASWSEALASAPEPVRIFGEAAISDCLPENQAAGKQATVGELALRVATGLARAERSGGRALPTDRDRLTPVEAATRAGYLVGALERGAAETGGIHAALVDRVESAATNGLEERPAAVREAYEAGRQAGLESG